MIYPLGARVTIELIEAESVTQGGIILAKEAQEKSNEGKVIKVGPGKITDDGKVLPIRVNEGDIVVFSMYGGTKYKDHIILNESDILAVVAE